jgi:hypothetical protein
VGEADEAVAGTQRARLVGGGEPADLGDQHTAEDPSVVEALGVEAEVQRQLADRAVAALRRVDGESFLDETGGKVVSCFSRKRREDGLWRHKPLSADTF